MKFMPKLQEWKLEVTWTLEVDLDHRNRCCADALGGSSSDEQLLSDVGTRLKLYIL